MSATIDSIVAPVKWWATKPEGWAEASAAAYAHWNETALDESAAIEAMAFGYGSRQAFAEVLVWEELEGKLQAAWQEAGFEGAHPWERARELVKQGWRVSAVVEPPTPAPMAVDASPVEPPVAPNVPGGRPGTHPFTPPPEERVRLATESDVPGGRPGTHPFTPPPEERARLATESDVPGGRPGTHPFTPPPEESVHYAANTDVTGGRLHQ